MKLTKFKRERQFTVVVRDAKRALKVWDVNATEYEVEHGDHVEIELSGSLPTPYSLCSIIDSKGNHVGFITIDPGATRKVEVIEDPAVVAELARKEQELAAKDAEARLARKTAPAEPTFVHPGEEEQDRLAMDGPDGDCDCREANCTYQWCRDQADAALIESQRGEETVSLDEALEVPASFDEALQDVEADNVVDMEVAFEETPEIREDESGSSPA